MKKLFLLLSATVLCASCVSVNKPVYKDKESSAIQSVIEQFLQAHGNRDYETWGSLWVPQPYVFLSVCAPDYHIYASGQTNICNGAKTYFTSEKAKDKEMGRTLTLKPHDFSFRIYQNNACVQFMITWTTTYKDGKEPETHETGEFYTLEKVDGTWKIASLNAVDITAYQKQAEEQKAAAEN